MVNLSERMREAVNKGIAASKDIAARAGEQAQVWGEKGTLRIEIMQLRSQAEKLISRLGAEVYAQFVEMSQSSIEADDPDIKSILVSIHEAEKSIDEKEAQYRALGGKDADLGNE
jgi:hypothetical protein